MKSPHEDRHLEHQFGAPARAPGRPLLQAQDPDVLCLQETKVERAVSRRIFEALGYIHRAFNGQKGYNGVAILSTHPSSQDRYAQLLRKDDAGTSRYSKPEAGR